MIIFPTFFVGNIGPVNVFYDILERKNVYKTRISKYRKNVIFRKWLTHGFGLKMAIFSQFFFSGNIGQDNLFYDILEQKNAFLGYKNKMFKKSKN